MLQFVPVNHPDSVFKIIDNSELGAATWIVSDLKSKNEIQKILLDQQGFFLETSILRASDFWRIALRRLAPHIQVVSQDFIRILVGNFVEIHGAALDIKEAEVSTLHAYISQLAPILLHAESDIVLSDWLTTQKKTKKWHRWYLLAKTCMNFIVFDHQLLDNQWIAAYLQNLEISHLDWPSNIVVDLGTEMSSVEMGLFKTLSQKINVKIIWPKPTWSSRFQFLLKTYQDNIGYGSAKTVETIQLQDSDRKPNKFVRVSTQLAEVKFAVHKIRQWVDSGVQLNDIAIVSAEIDKSYWPVLKFFLDHEGLIYQKDQIVKLNTIAAVQNFTAFATNLMADVSWDSLETSLFSKLTLAETSFDGFKSLFYQLYDDSDLLRDDKIKNLFYKKLDLAKKIKRDEFLIQIIKIWSESSKYVNAIENDKDTQLFEVIFKDFLARSIDVSATFKSWFQFLLACINAKEMKIAAGADDGLQILPLMSSHLCKANYQICLGTDEKSISAHKKSLISAADVFELKTKFDFAVDYPEESFFDFNIRWLAERQIQEKIYLCANSSFEAEPLTPALFFLENNSKHDLHFVEATRHDQIQAEKATQTLVENCSNKGLKRDLFQSPNLVELKMFDSLSPSNLEDYWKCPFKLMVQKAFRLSDLPQVAMDLDPRQKGSLLHLLFEYLATAEGKAEPEKFLDNKRIELKIYPQDDLLWYIQKNKLLQIASKFLSFESDRKKVNLAAVVKATEASFEMRFDLESKNFVPLDSKTNRSILIKGRVDRIDQNGEAETVVYDYKSKTADLKNHGDWLKAGEFQLLLYLIACESYLYPGKNVIASVYYDYRKFETQKGFITESYQNGFLEPARKRKSLSDEDGKAALISEFSKTLDQMFLKLENFDFSAIPVDQKICNTCNWSKLCRAPHMM